MSKTLFWELVWIAIGIGVVIAFPPILMILVVGGFIYEVLFKSRAGTPGDEPGDDF